MTDITRVGCFTNKIKLADKIKEWKRPLAIVALIHHIGAYKYPYYSWYNHPSTSDATPEDNFNAILRHFTAHRIGKTIDSDSKLPHIFHAVCRAGMLITNLYRDINNCHDQLENTVGVHVPLDWDVGSQITAEEILLISKADQCAYYNSIKDAPAYISRLLGNLILTDTLRKVDPANIFTNINPADELVLNIWAYANDLIKEHLISYENTPYAQAEVFINKYIDGTCKPDWNTSASYH